MKIKRIPYQQATDGRVNYWTAMTGRRFHKEVDNTAHARLLELKESGGLGSLLWCYDENGRMGEQYKWHTFDRLKTTYVIAQYILSPEEARKILKLAENSPVELTKEWVKEFRKNVKSGLYEISDVRTGDLGLRRDLDSVWGGDPESYFGAYRIATDKDNKNGLEGLTMNVIEYQRESDRDILNYISAPEEWTSKESTLRSFVERMQFIPCQTFLLGLPRY